MLEDFVGGIRSITGCLYIVNVGREGAISLVEVMEA